MAVLWLRNEVAMTRVRIESVSWSPAGPGGFAMYARVAWRLHEGVYAAWSTEHLPGVPRSIGACGLKTGGEHEAGRVRSGLVV